METMEMKTMEINTHHLFNEQIRLKDIREFGMSWQELLTGAVDIPLQGARFDVLFEGDIQGPYLSGTKKGIDYLLVRADGQFIINLRAEIITPEGERIAVQESGILSPAKDGSSTGHLQLNMKFITASEKYGWINGIQAWGVGKANLLNGTVEVTAFKS